MLDLIFYVRNHVKRNQLELCFVNIKKEVKNQLLKVVKLNRYDLKNYGKNIVQQRSVCVELFDSTTKHSSNIKENSKES